MAFRTRQSRPRVMRPPGRCTAKPCNLLARYLLPLSLIYLAIPNILFAAGWLKWYYALPCTLLIVFPLVRAWRRAGAPTAAQQTAAPTLGPSHLALLLSTVLLLMLLSGIGGWGYQETDWLKHNAIFKDLFERPWPVIYDFGGNDLPLVYYLAYYLPPAFLGKLAGWVPANHALFAWSLLGLALALLWFLVLNRRAGATVLFTFAFFSGLDIVGRLLITPLIAIIQPEASELLRWDHIEGWAYGWQYSSNATLLFWVPNQALAGWIATGALMYLIQHTRSKTYHLFILSLTALWSPFVCLGLLPFLLADLLAGQGALLDRLRHYRSIPNLCGLLLLSTFALFYSAKLYPLPSYLSGEIPHGFSLASLPDAHTKALGFLLILVFCLLEFGLYAILIYRSRAAWQGKTPALFLAALAFLALLPFYRFGALNDLGMRASIPALFVLAVFLSRTLHASSPPARQRIVLIALLLIGSFTVLIELHRHVAGILENGALLSIPELSAINELWLSMPRDAASTLLQYIGSSQAPFFKYFARYP